MSTLQTCSKCRRISQEPCMCSFMPIYSVTLPSRLTLSDLEKLVLKSRVKSLVQSYKDLESQVSRFLKDFLSIYDSTLSTIDSEIKYLTSLLKDKSPSVIDLKKVLYYKDHPLTRENFTNLYIEKYIKDFFTQFVQKPAEIRVEGQEFHKDLMIKHDITAVSHEKSINTIAISHDEQFMVSAGNDKIIQVWDLNKYCIIKTLVGHKSLINYAIISYDSLLVFSCDLDKKIIAWDISSGTIYFQLQHQTDFITSLAISRDNLTLISGSKDSTIAVYSLYVSENPAPVILSEHSGTVMTVAFNSDFSKILSGASDKTIKVWSMHTKQIESTLKGHTGSVTCIVNLANPQEIASSSQDKTIRIWSLFTLAQIRVLEEHSSEIRHLIYSTSLDLLVSSSLDKTSRVWDVNNFSVKGTLSGHKHSVNSAVFFEKRNAVITASNDKTIRVWNLEKFHEVYKLPGHNELVKLCAFNENETYLVTYALDKTLRLWDVLEKTQIFCSNIEADVKDLIFSNDSKYVFVKGGAERIWIYEIETFEVFQEIKSQNDLECWVGAYPNIGEMFIS